MYGDLTEHSYLPTLNHLTQDELEIKKTNKISK